MFGMDKKMANVKRIEGDRRGLTAQRMLNALTRRLIGTITRVITNEALVALTFDDGPHHEFTPRILHILAKYKAHATFFMVGKRAQRHKELVKKVWQSGHAIGNHSWDHPSFPLISRNERRRQLRLCANAIAPYGQRLFRPPYGHQNIASYIDVVLSGYKVLTWNTIAYDWKEDQDPEWMANQLKDNVKPGMIILLHDALCVARQYNRENVNTALEIFLDQVTKQLEMIQQN